MRRPEPLTSFSIYYILAGRFKPCLLLLILFFQNSKFLHCQEACNYNTASVINVCSNTVIDMGVGTLQDYYYTWYKDGAILRGPLSGTGGQLSFQFTLESQLEAGHYYIERTRFAAPTVCEYNVRYTLPYNVPNQQTLSGNELLCYDGGLLSIDNSQYGVNYQMLKDNNLVGTAIPGTGAGFNFPPITSPGSYRVKASYATGCNGGPSYTNEILVSNLPQPSLIYTTSSSANFQWWWMNNYFVEFGLAGFTPGTGASPGVGGTLLSINNVSEFTLSGLLPNTEYTVYVRTACGTNSFSNNSGKTFRTDCGPTITSFPYNEGFESVSPPNLPVCWKIMDIGGNNANSSGSWVPSTLFPRSGSYSLTAYPGGDYLIIPPVSLSGNKRLKYFVRTNNDYLVDYKIKISTTDNRPSSFSTTLISENGLTQTYTEKTIDLSAYSGNVYLAIQSISGNLHFDDFKIETIPVCPGPSFVQLNSTTNTTATISWMGSGSFFMEYGPAGYTPGTGNLPGATGMSINGATSPTTILGLTAGTSYDVYIRQNCGGPYSANSPKLNLATFLNCSTGPILALNTTVSTSIPSGTGNFDFPGIYPSNSVGVFTGGKELIYRFTPATSGVYYIKGLDASIQPKLAYFIKPVSGGCSNQGWTGVTHTNFNNGISVLGQLTAAVQYYILVDCSKVTGTPVTFQVRKATVGGEWGMGGTGGPVPANSTKTEYLIDDDGNLIAALDFSSVPKSMGNVFATYSVNTGSVRRDENNKEYLDRQFNLSADSLSDQPFQAKFYFTNAELQRLIDEPNDGIGDVGSILDLKATRTVEDLQFGNILTPVATGSFDVSSSFVQISSNRFNNFYLHGGLEPLYSPTRLCPISSNIYFYLTPLEAGFNYQWQVDEGTGFVNIQEGYPYFDVNTPTLLLNYSPTSFNGNKYRCVAVNGGTTITSNHQTLLYEMYWNGTNDTDWENAANWDCNVVPDSNTDVIIPASATYFPVIVNNVSCKSVWVKQGASVKVDPGYRLTITGK